MSDPVDDRILEEYLHRKSALSMGYRRVYVEAPPPELDRAITARARRAARWLIPGALAVVIGGLLVFGVNYGVIKYVRVLVQAEQNVERLKKARKQEEEERARTESGVSVIIDANATANTQPTREEWLAKVEALKQAGKQAEAEAELRRFKAAYPEKNASKK